MKVLRFPILFFAFSLILCVKGFAAKTESVVTAPAGEKMSALTFNGAWCWFSDPPAVYYEGVHSRTYTGWIDNFGSVHVAYYDHRTGEIATKIVWRYLEIDDHNNPSITFDNDGRLIIYFNTHMIGAKPLYMIKALDAESIERWGEIKSLSLNKVLPTDSVTHRTGHHCYTNPITLSEDNGRTFLFWRGADGKPTYAFSDDKGETWSDGRIFFRPEVIYKFRRPYSKIYSNGKSKIHITVTDGHPANEQQNCLYYVSYSNGAFRDVKGREIARAEQLPMRPKQVDMVYDARPSGMKAWNWDIAEDKNGYPLIAYAKFQPQDTTHIYCVARWNGKRWMHSELMVAGRWFPKTLPGKIEREPYYSGGMSIDKENTNVIYVSVNRNGVFEIERLETTNNWRTWTVTPVTSGSKSDNVRPFAVRGAGEGNPVQVLWMQNFRYIHFAYCRTNPIYENRYMTSVKWESVFKHTTEMKKDAVVANKRRCADILLGNQGCNNKILHTGPYMMLYAAVASMNQASYATRYDDELQGVVHGFKHHYPENNPLTIEQTLDITNFYNLMAKKDIKQMICMAANHWSADRPRLFRMISLLNLYGKQGKPDPMFEKVVKGELKKIATKEATQLTTLELYFLAWGHNRGIVKAENLIKEGWKNLSQCLDDQNKFMGNVALGGAYILAGCEILKMIN